MAPDAPSDNSVCAAQGDIGQQTCPNAALAQKFPALDPQAALFLDVDGTLLDIAPTPEEVRVPPELPALLARLARQRNGALALVSGRRLADIDRLFAPWRGPAAGLHGAERRRADGSIVPLAAAEADRRAAAAITRIRPLAEEFAALRPGLRCEDKGLSLALHYRAAPERGGEADEFARHLCDTLGEGALRLIPGKMVFELQPANHGKDGAIAAFLAEPPFRGRMPVFLGDDVTDEDGFVEINRHGGLSIRVGPPAASAANHALPSVSAALAWLQMAGSR